MTTETNTFIQNYPKVNSALDRYNGSLNINKDSILSSVRILSALLSPFHDETIQPNGVITTADDKRINICYNSINIRCPYNAIIELPLMKVMCMYDGASIPVYVNAHSHRKGGKLYIHEIIEPQNIKQLLENFKEYINKGNFITAYRYFNVMQTILSPFIKGDVKIFCIKIRKDLEPVSEVARKVTSININFTNTSFQVTHSTSEELYHTLKDDVRSLLAEEYHDEAVQLLIDGLCNENIEPKRKSDLYKTLVDIYNKVERFVDAVKIYKQWINHCIVNNLSTHKRISRMYTLLAKLEAPLAGYENDALANIKEAMKYEPNSGFHISLYNSYKEIFEARKHLTITNTTH